MCDSSVAKLRAAIAMAGDESFELLKGWPAVFPGMRKVWLGGQHQDVDATHMDGIVRLQLLAYAFLDTSPCNPAGRPPRGEEEVDALMFACAWYWALTPEHRGSFTSSVHRVDTVALTLPRFPDGRVYTAFVVANLDEGVLYVLLDTDANGINKVFRRPGRMIYASRVTFHGTTGEEQQFETEIVPPEWFASGKTSPQMESAATPDCGELEDDHHPGGVLPTALAAEPSACGDTAHALDATLPDVTSALAAEPSACGDTDHALDATLPDVTSALAAEPSACGDTDHALGATLPDVTSALAAAHKELVGGSVGPCSSWMIPQAHLLALDGVLDGYLATAYFSQRFFVVVEECAEHWPERPTCLEDGTPLVWINLAGEEVFGPSYELASEDLHVEEAGCEKELAELAEVTTRAMHEEELTRWFAEHRNLRTLGFSTRRGAVVLRAGITAPGFLPIGEEPFPSTWTDPVSGHTFPVDVCSEVFQFTAKATDMHRPVVGGVAIGDGSEELPHKCRTLGGVMWHTLTQAWVGVTAAHGGWVAAAKNVYQPPVHAQMSSFFADKKESLSHTLGTAATILMVEGRAFATCSKAVEGYMERHNLADKFQAYLDSQQWEVCIGQGGGRAFAKCENVPFEGQTIGVDAALVQLAPPESGCTPCVPSVSEVMTWPALMDEPSAARFVKKCGAMTGETYGKVWAGDKLALVREFSHSVPLKLVVIHDVPGALHFAAYGDSGAFATLMPSDDLRHGKPPVLLGLVSGVSSSGRVSYVSPACAWAAEFNLVAVPPSEG